MIEILGIALLVQGIGGFINRIAGSGSKSWFVQLHVLPESMHIPASVVMAVVGGILVLAAGAKRTRSRR
ncbi:hypothetical protein [Amycolatopsis anabasis]|uniref:hypothetical protein n=1 Tax=Amycolatopsis anabasis TaxID=1840409 RepID=UPI00131D65BB|nr:hypothetical protein [Amycolatopsis anabasis]